MKIYLYLPLGSGTMHYKYPSAPRAESSIKLRSPYNAVFHTEDLYVNANVYQQRDSGKRVQYEGDRQSFTSYQRIEVKGLTLSEEERKF